MVNTKANISKFLYKKRWLAFSITVVAIFLGAICGSLTGLPRTGISVWWPPAGIALASFLLIGYSMAPAVFLGNFFYNTYNLYQLGAGDFSLLNIFLTATAVSTGSLLQALIGASLIRHYSPVNHFYGIKEQVIFLLYGGLLTCITAASIGVVSLNLNGFISSQELLKTWLTFWIGDTVGVYILTPLLVVWSKKFEPPTLHEKWEIVLAAFYFIIVSYFLFIKNMPITVFYIPIIFWASMRFFMHGASLTIFILSSTAILAASFGYGAVMASGAVNPMILLGIFILVIVGSCLFSAGALQERETAKELLKKLNENLEHAVGVKTQELDEIQERLGSKEKLASLGTLISTISLKMKTPMTYVHGLSNLSQVFVDMLDDSFAKERHLMDSKNADKMDNALQGLKTSLLKLSENEKQANKILDVMIQQSMTECHPSLDYRLQNINSLLDVCLEQIMKEIKVRYAHMNVIFERHYDESAMMIDIIPEDLTHAFDLLLDHTTYLLSQRYRHTEVGFIPTIIVKTENKNEKVLISIKDNGQHKENIETLIHKETDGIATGLAVVYDIIVNEHQGQIESAILEDGFYEINIYLPKTRHTAGSKFPTVSA